MSLLSALRAGVAVANRVTRSGGLQPTVMYTRMTGPGGSGPVYATPVPLHALVEDKAVQVRVQDGTESTTRSVLTLLDINELIAATSGFGVTTDDIFTLPNGRSAPVLSLGGFIDAGTGHPLATDVYLG